MPACVEPSMPSDPDRRRVVPPNGGRQHERSARCPSQPSPGICAPRRSPSSFMCHQRRSAAGRRRAGCPSSLPWAATDATPTPRSGPCWKPCPSYPRPASPRALPNGPGITVVRGSVAVRDRPALDRGRIGPGCGRLPPCERQSGRSGDLGQRSEAATDLGDRLTVARRHCPWSSTRVRPSAAQVTSLQGTVEGEGRCCSGAEPRGQGQSARAVDDHS